MAGNGSQTTVKQMAVTRKEMSYKNSFQSTNKLHREESTMYERKFWFQTESFN